MRARIDPIFVRRKRNDANDGSLVLGWYDGMRSDMVANVRCNYTECEGVRGRKFPYTFHCDEQPMQLHVERDYEEKQ